MADNRESSPDLFSGSQQFIQHNLNAVSQLNQTCSQVISNPNNLIEGKILGCKNELIADIEQIVRQCIGVYVENNCSLDIDPNTKHAIIGASNNMNQQLIQMMNDKKQIEDKWQEQAQNSENGKNNSLLLQKQAIDGSCRVRTQRKEFETKFNQLNHFIDVQLRLKTAVIKAQIKIAIENAFSSLNNANVNKLNNIAIENKNNINSNCNGNSNGLHDDNNGNNNINRIDSTVNSYCNNNGQLLGNNISMNSNGNNVNYCGNSESTVDESGSNYKAAVIRRMAKRRKKRNVLSSSQSSQSLQSSSTSVHSGLHTDVTDFDRRADGISFANS